MDRNLIQKILIGLFISGCLIAGIKTMTIGNFAKTEVRNEKLEVKSAVISSRMTYWRFL